MDSLVPPSRGKGKAAGGAAVGTGLVQANKGVDTMLARTVRQAALALIGLAYLVSVAGAQTGVANDANTLLLLRFDGTATGVAGQVSLDASGLTVDVSDAPDAALARTGTLVIANQRFVVEQAGTPAPPMVSPTPTPTATRTPTPMVPSVSTS